MSSVTSSVEPQNLWLFERNKLLILKSLFCCDNHLCGSDFIDELDMPKNLVSYHLKTLRENGYVVEQAVGRTKNYQLHQEKVNEVIQILKVVGLVADSTPSEPMGFIKKQTNQKK